MAAIGGVEIGARMPERDEVAGGGQRPDQIDSAWKLRRQRHDADGRACVFDDFENLRAGERPCHGAAVFVRRPQTRQRLRATEVGVDEIALEMRR